MPASSPRDLLAAKGEWPVGPWRKLAPAERLALDHVAAIAIAIRGARSGRHMTQARLAEIAGVSEATVGRIESGRAWPDLRTTWLLLGALDITEWPQPDR